MFELDEDEIQNLYAWIDSIKLNRPKRNISRDFSDGVACAEVIKQFFPNMVDLHNYSQANSQTQKRYNWNTLNQKVFKRLGYTTSDEIIMNIVNCKPGYIEYLLYELRQKIQEHVQSQDGHVGKQLEKIPEKIEPPPVEPNSRVPDVRPPKPLPAAETRQSNAKLASSTHSGSKHSLAVQENKLESSFPKGKSAKTVAIKKESRKVPESKYPPQEYPSKDDSIIEELKETVQATQSNKDSPIKSIKTRATAGAEGQEN